MANQWIIKPVGGQQLSVTVPDSLTVEKMSDIDVLQLQRAISEWLEEQAKSGTSTVRAASPMGWCIAGCGVQA